MNRKNILNRVVFLIGLICLFVAYFVVKSPGADMAIYVLDVGQGDSLLIRTVDQRYILIDGGPDESALSEMQKVIPFFVREIDLVILTHPDQDHVGGLPKVLDYYDVEAVAYTPIEHQNRAYSELKQKIKERNIEHIELDEDSDFRIGCCTYFDVLWPLEDAELADFADDPNDASTAFVMYSGDFSMFFGGDLRAEYEEQIAKDIKGQVDVLKVGHHGSSTSTSEEFVKKLKPEYAVISVGRDNRYGHPTRDVLQTLEESDVVIYRTDEQGRIKLQF